MDPDTNFCPVEIKGPTLAFRMFLTTIMALSMVVLSLLSTPSVQSSAASAWPMFHGNAQHTGLSPFPGPTVPFLRWTFQTGGPVDASPAVGHGRIYVTSEDGNLYALNMQGQLLWKFQTPCHDFEFGAVTPALGSDGTIYLAGHICGGERPNGILYSINPAGRQKWNFTNPNPGEGVDSFISPTIGPNGTIYVSDVGFRIFAFNPDGTVKWQVATHGEVVGPPAVALDGTVYVEIDDPPPTGSCQQVLNKCLIALNPDGTFRWGLFSGGSSSPAVGSDGTIYAGGTAINPDGTVKWQFFAGGIDSVGPDGTIYLSGDGLNAVKPEGTLKWRFAIDNGTSSCTSIGCSYVFVQQSSAAIGSNGIIYFGRGVTNLPSGQAGNGIGSVYAIAPNGTLVWKLGVGSVAGICGPGFCERVFSVSDPAIGSDGTIYVGSSDGNLYAIG